MRDAFARTVYEIAQQDPKVFVVVADISPAAAMAKFLQEFPDRFVNVGLAEQAMIGLCAGLARRGCTTFAYTIATFSIYRPFEQVRDDLCYQDVPVTVVGVGGGVQYSLLGGTHHAQEDIAIMGSIPNMHIVAPCDPSETASATRACVELKRPVYLRLGKAGEPDLTSQAPEPFAFGKIRLIKPGSGVALLSYGPVTRLALEAAKQIDEAHGGSAAVYSVHTLKPLDDEGVARVLAAYRHVVVVEEHSERAGLAAAVKALAWDSGATCALHLFSLKDAFIHVYGSHQDVLTAHGISVPAIVERVSKAL